MADKSSKSQEDEEERKHFQRIVNAFRCYRSHSIRRLHRSLKFMNTLPKFHQRVLEKYKLHLEKVRVGIEHNYEIIKLIIKDVAYMFENADHTNDVKASSQIQTLLSDNDKVQSIFKQIMREWSEDGKEERNSSFTPILNEISERFPENSCNLKDIHILVPGAGLGRLSYEIARRGYTCQGNEYSLFMLFASNFMLNKCKGVNLFRVYPWIHQYCNVMDSEDQVRPSTFPDVDPSDLPPNSEFSMAAGNFTEAYTEPDSWDCIATCFFMDTANNIVSYIETIWNILKPGGYWINLGPLLYHFADIPNEFSIEPSYEEVKKIILSFGFQMLKEKTGLRTPYTQNPRSMMFYEYRSVFFVCQKPIL
ncbi:carnosine N-methyltransferase [Centruroides vittatus]|uniref:carnosine N-methyltransferase n=2 Tax=Centruroides TaxID=6875 RepID=UPI003510030C